MRVVGDVSRDFQKRQEILELLPKVQMRSLWDMPRVGGFELELL